MEIFTTNSALVGANCRFWTALLWRRYTNDLVVVVEQCHTRLERFTSLMFELVSCEYFDIGESLSTSFVETCVLNYERHVGMMKLEVSRHADRAVEVFVWVKENN